MDVQADSERVREFSEAVCHELGNYVYRLIDPRNGETFYVGKGKKIVSLHMSKKRWN